MISILVFLVLRYFFDAHINLGHKLGYKSMEDWYQVTSKDFRESGGKELLQKYTAPSEIITEVFNDHEWLTWKFQIVPKNFWMNHQSKLNYVEYLTYSLIYMLFHDLTRWLDILEKI